MRPLRVLERPTGPPAPAAIVAELVDGLPKLLTLAEAAELLRVTTRTLRTWSAEGRLAVLRQGRLIRVPRSEVERLLRELVEPPLEGRA